MEKMLNNDLNNAFVVENIHENGFHTFILTSSIFPSTIWDKTSASYARTEFHVCPTSHITSHQTSPLTGLSPSFLLYLNLIPILFPTFKPISNQTSQSTSLPTLHPTSHLTSHPASQSTTHPTRPHLTTFSSSWPHVSLLDPICPNLTPLDPTCLTWTLLTAFWSFRAYLRKALRMHGQIFGQTHFLSCLSQLNNRKSKN